MSSDQKPPDSQQGAVDLSSLTVPQLRSLQTRLNSELEHLTNSHSKLRVAQSKFRECIRSINEGVVKDSGGAGGSEKGDILVPLTSSLYVKGQMADREKVLVDVGTGFFVEKTAPKALEFYKSKTEEMGQNLQDLEKVLQAKGGNAKVVEDVLRQKVLNGEGGETTAGSGGGE